MQNKTLRCSCVVAIVFLLQLVFVRTQSEKEKEVEKFALPSPLTPPNSTAAKKRLDQFERQQLALAPPQANNRCDKTREFQCENVKRCIPIGWQCDFTPQCEDESDEVGCVPVKCEISSSSGGLCNWRAINTETWQRYSKTQASSASNEKNKEALQELAADAKEFLFVQLASGESTSISTPLIGRTNSMCQLRFEFAIWHNQPNSLVRLNLISRDKKSNFTRLFWSAQLEGDNQSKGLTVERRARANWQVGVAELGNLKQVELSFEATTVERRKRKAGEQEVDSSSRAQHLVALRKFEFHECGGWRSSSGAFRSGGRNQLAKSERSGRNWLDLSDQNDDDDDKEANEEQNDAGCARNEFWCPNSTCLASKRVCNFVDDCDGLDETQQLCSPVLGRENFDLWPSYESFRSAAFDKRAANKSCADGSCKRREPFWLLSGSWPRKLISIRDNTSGESHAPARDHTQKSAHGRYLSLEVPTREVDGTTRKKLADEKVGGTLLAWAHLSSPWLERVNPRDECRVKLFFNLVQQPPIGQQLEEGEGSAKWPFKLSLAVEHFTLDFGRRHSTRLVRKLDSLTQQSARQSDGGAFGGAEAIEFPGVDFWRELNVELADLSQGDVFFARLTLFVEYEKQLRVGPQTGSSKWTINIDDLSTDFGCAYANLNKLSRALELVERSPQSSRNNFQLSELDHFRLADYQPKHLVGSSSWQLANLHGKELESESQQVPPQVQQNIEPQKLVAYVLFAFCSIAGSVITIVFVVVPCVERTLMSHEQRLQLGNCDELSDAPVVGGTPAAAGGSSGGFGRRNTQHELLWTLPTQHSSPTRSRGGGGQSTSGGEVESDTNSTLTTSAETLFDEFYYQRLDSSRALRAASDLTCTANSICTSSRSTANTSRATSEC